jgi:RNA polymerase sigma-70 factor, ECF subfamily
MGPHLELVQRLFVRHQNELRGVLLAILPDFSALDDVLQETFLTVSRKAAEFRPESNFAAWAAAIARIHAMDRRRQQGRWVTGLSEEVIDQLYAHPSALVEPQLADRELAALDRCLEALAPQARRAVELRYRDGHKPAEVARRLGWTGEAIYVALSRARAALRECVARRLAAGGGIP